jgi:transposase
MTHYDFVGVDVAKDKFDVAIAIKGQYKHVVFSNCPKGHKEFHEWLTQHTLVPWVCMEATGHYSVTIADFLVKNAIRVSVINPFQVKNFARASLARNKNDCIDAKIIAQFGQRMEPRVYQTAPAEQKEVKDLTKLLDMLKAQLVQLNNQLHSTQGIIARKALGKLVGTLEKEIAKIEKKIADLVADNKALNEQFNLLTSIKGVGKLTAFRIIALMPDVNSFATAKQFAAYIGITPKHNQSGTFIGKTTISRLGDSRLRKSLYMAALVAKNFNKGLTNFVSRLQHKGKNPKTIICAVMRKLAHIIFGVLKSKQPFDENFACF